MIAKKHPVCYIVAGPNGAGKTTFALQYLPKIASCNNFINADEIARGISPLDIEAGLLPASRIFLSREDIIYLQRRFSAVIRGVSETYSYTPTFATGLSVLTINLAASNRFLKK